LERSKQLREHYKSLLEGETEQANKRPSATLSPEDLIDAEWYYLVCMSIVINSGHCLPGRALTNSEKNGYAMLSLQIVKYSVTL
ncbi:hypothetical protein CUMW_177820, partial [Citrus unshiu]